MATPAAQPEQPQPPPEHTGPVVVFDNVSIAFEDKQVLEDISFTVEPGETRIILGPAGCGKSVLLKLVNGLIHPDSGSIHVFGEEVSTMREIDLFKLRAHIGMVFQESALFDSMSVKDNVAYRMQQDLVAPDEVHERVLESLRFVELEDAVAKFPSELSGGMRRRVAIARAVVTKPELILYDSPTGGLDPITSTTIIELVIKQRDAWHNTSLVVTHRLQDAFMMATNEYDTKAKQVRRIPNNGIDPKTRFLVLNEGKIVFDGTTQELVASEDPWIKEYLT
jgi:phospholipid/cholesterol/gamma-HCH transport system ATP-binding protein